MNFQYCLPKRSPPRSDQRVPSISSSPQPPLSISLAITNYTIKQNPLISRRRFVIRMFKTLILCAFYWLSPTSFRIGASDKPDRSSSHHASRHFEKKSAIVDFCFRHGLRRRFNASRYLSLLTFWLVPQNSEPISVMEFNFLNELGLVTKIAKIVSFFCGSIVFQLVCSNPIAMAWVSYGLGHNYELHTLWYIVIVKFWIVKSLLSPWTCWVIVFAWHLGLLNCLFF